jgi:hypothetical protein
VSEPPKPDPQEEAERQLRLMLAAEQRRQHAQLAMVQKGFYGCVGLLVLILLALLFFS